MTTWLDFRSEPIVDVPEMEIKPLHKSELPLRYVVNCLAPDCSFTEKTKLMREAIWAENDHKQWHEDGMPE